MSNNKEADAKFEEAIKEYLEAQGDDEGFLIDWLLVCAHHLPHDDGSSGTALALYINFEQGLHRTIGLARYAVLKSEGRIQS